MTVVLGRACKIVGSLRSQNLCKTNVIWSVTISQSLQNKAISSAEVDSSILQSLQTKKTIQSPENRGFDPQLAADKILYRGRRSFDLSPNNYIYKDNIMSGRSLILSASRCKAKTYIECDKSWVRSSNRCSTNVISSAGVVHPIP
jgi:hypothetical protein